MFGGFSLVKTQVPSIPSLPQFNIVMQFKCLIFPLSSRDRVLYLDYTCCKVTAQRLWCLVENTVWSGNLACKGKWTRDTKHPWHPRDTHGNGAWCLVASDFHGKIATLVSRNLPILSNQLYMGGQKILHQLFHVNPYLPELQPTSLLLHHINTKEFSRGEAQVVVHEGPLSPCLALTHPKSDGECFPLGI